MLWVVLRRPDDCVSVRLTASLPASWFPLTCIRVLSACVFWSKPSFLLPAICAVCLLWSQSHSSIEWHGCRRERPGHSLIPLGSISFQSRRSLPDWLLWLMPNAGRGSPEATERSPDCVFLSGESLRSHCLIKETWETVFDNHSELEEMFSFVQISYICC